MANSETSGFRPDQENVVYVGAGVTLKGQLSVPDVVVVDGLVEGDIKARAVLVGKTGVIRGTIAATEADIGGQVVSHVEIDHLLVVRSTGRVEGRVVYGEIELEKGAVLMGDLAVKTGQRAATKPLALAREVAVERQDAPTVAVAPKGNASIDRLNEAVRAAKGVAAGDEASSAGAASSAPAAAPAMVAPDAAARRRNVLRLPLSSRRAKA
jgi:cytoskeletal protein CcmA (bactofilin family)